MPTYLDFHKTAIKSPQEIYDAVIASDKAFIQLYKVTAFGKKTQVCEGYGADHNVRDGYFGITDPERLRIARELTKEYHTCRFTLVYLQGPTDQRHIQQHADGRPFYISSYGSDYCMPCPTHNHNMLFLKREDAEAYANWCIDDEAECTRHAIRMDLCDSTEHAWETYNSYMFDIDDY